MTGPFVAQAVVKDLRRRLRDPWSLLLWLGVPLMVGTLITVGVGGDGPPTARLLLADEDGSLASGALSAALSGGGADSPLAQLLEVEPVSRAEGSAMMERGAASALLIVPTGFGAAVLADEPVELELVTNPSQSVLPAIAEETLSIAVDAVYYAQRLFGEQIATVAAAVDDGAAPSSEQIAAIAVGVNDRLQRALPLLTPPVIVVEAVDVDGGDGASLALLFLPGILLMSLLLTAGGLSADFWQERENGTLARLSSSPQPLSRYVAAKFGAAALTFAVVSAPLLLAGFAWHGLAPARLPLAAVMMVLFGVALYGLLSLLQLLAPTRKSASLLGGLVLFPLMMVGGSFFPFETMPGWLAAIGRVSPNGAMLEQLKRYLMAQQSAAALALTLLASLAAIALLLGGVTLRQRSVARG